MTFLLKIKAWLASLDLAHGIGAVIGAVWRWIKALPRRIWTACVAFIKTPAVWLSAPAFLLAGYVAAFLLMQGKMERVRDQVSGLAASKVEMGLVVAGLRAQNAELVAALAKAKEPQAPVAAVAAPVDVKSPPAASPAPAKRKPKPAEPVKGWVLW